MPNDRLVTAVSASGRIFKKISYLLPYISAIGSGMDCVPNVGDTCIVLAGDKSFEFVIGFRLSLAEGGELGAELGGRIKDLPEGSIGFRAVAEDGSEAKMILYRGGTALIGSGSMAVSVYTPMGFISHLFDNWTMEGPGGHIKWLREPGTNKVSYEAEYRVKTNPKDPGYRVNVSIKETTNEEEDPVSVTVSRKQDDPNPAMRVAFDKDGRVKVSANIMEIEALATLSLKAQNLVLNGRRIQPLQEPI